MMLGGKTGSVRFSIKNKIIAGFFCFFLIYLLTIGITYVKLDGTQQFTKRLQNQALPTFESIQNINISLLESLASLQAWMRTRGNIYKQQQVSIWQHMNVNIASINGYSSKWKSQNLKAKWAKIKKLLIELESIQTQIREMPISNLNSEILLGEKVLPISIEVKKLLGGLGVNALNDTGLANVLNNQLRADVVGLDEDVALLKMLQIILLGIGLIIGIIVTSFTAKSIVNPIKKAIGYALKISNGERNIEIKVEGNDETSTLLISLKDMYLAICEAENKLKDKEEQVKKLYRSLETRIKTCRDYIELVASGDLTKTLTITGDDDLAMLGVHLNKMTSGLASIAKQIITASTDISVGLNQLEATTSSQATSATQQASSVSEVSAVVGKIRVASAQTLHKAQELGISAEQIYQKGESGKKAVNDIIPSMKTLQKKMGETAGTILNLNDKMKQISEITEVVSDIAKQSKMLALNASIEAAKAGDVGRGFSVVASEIRALSVRSQSSTEDVKKILRDIQKATEQVVIAADEGSELVEENVQEVEKTGGIINALAQVIQESSMASQQIAASIRQESEGIDQVVSSMSEIDQVTQQFSAASKQTSMASSKLGEVSKALAEQAKKYKV